MDPAPATPVRASWLTDRGRRRASNEDAVGGDPEAEVFVVADGLGGLPGGERASRIAVETLLPAIARLTRNGLLEEGIRRAIGEADAAIRAAGRAEPRHAGMATTVVLAVGSGASWLIAHVGDSRAYLLAGRILLLTTDHNAAAELAAAGRITPAEAQSHPGRNVVTRALGAGIRSDPDLRRVPRRPGDRLLLCTDGLTAVVAADEIGEVLGRVAEPVACCRELVAIANERGGPDNVTVLVADCPAR